jgi:nucleoside-diphosphate-sugar epimerase
VDDLRGRRVLVTGGAGFLGANLTRELVRRGAVVSVLVRPSTDLRRIGDLLPELTLQQADIVDRAALQRTVRRLRPEILFHLAARGGDPVQRESWDAYAVNVLGTAHLLEAVAPLDFDRLVHLGTSMEYGPRRRPLREEDRLAPTTLRGASKVAATLLCQQFARAHGRPVVVLRPFPVYGYWEPPTRLIPTAIRAALYEQEMALTPPGYRRDLIFVEDVVDACLRAATAGRLAGQVINVGTGQEWTNEAVVELVEALVGRRIHRRLGAHPPRAWDTTCWAADIRKAERLLGWVPQHTLASGLEKSIAWWRRQVEAEAS